MEVQELRTYFFTRWGTVKAVDGVSFTVAEGESLGLVGESGCGKTVTAFSILRLVPGPAGRIVGGKILWEGENLLDKSEAEMTRIRGRGISMILQDPLTSLNPVFSIGEQIMETIRVHQSVKGKDLWEKAKKMLQLVNIPSPEVRLRHFPHQMSGGMRQRIVGAIALSCQPKLLIADEPTTSLDVTIQAQYLALLKDIQRQTKIALIFITHDFGIVAEMCDKVAIMYAGKIVETAEVRELFNSPLHPYTSALMQSVPDVAKRVDRLATIEGQPPPLYDLPPGCSFAPRCHRRNGRCQVGFPPPVKVRGDHWVSCWLYG